MHERVKHGRNTYMCTEGESYYVRLYSIDGADGRPIRMFDRVVIDGGQSGVYTVTGLRETERDAIRLRCGSGCDPAALELFVSADRARRIS